MHHETITIGIAGGSASGKSTISEILSKRLQDVSVKLIHMDKYFKKVRPMIVAPYTGKTYEDHNHPDVIDFDTLIKDYQASHGKYDVIIIEGLFTLHHDEIRSFLDLKIFIDCQADERIIRRIKRNLAWGLSFDEITDVYLDAVRHRHQTYVEPSRWHADMVLNGSTPSDVGYEIITNWIQANRGDK